LKRALLIVGALLLGLVGLFMSLCGGGFSLMAVTNSGALAILPIAVPSLLGGISLIWGCVRILSRVTDEPDR
jgi:hypothetical protein